MRNNHFSTAIDAEASELLSEKAIKLGVDKKTIAIIWPDEDAVLISEYARRRYEGNTGK
ncbi:MAG: hypothetical protein KAU16_05980 [Methanophagales archaeon]|nr:hypothetical protein [Methanophagales archaeon]